jgi:chemotaxis protein histidine kinase CheA/ActR/RegA family two-component response regulator
VTPEGVAGPLEEYAGHVGRIRDTAHLLGLLGLVAGCDVINESLIATAALPDANWTALQPFFDGWPALTIAYLGATADAGLCERLAAHIAGSPVTMDSSGKGDLIEMLLAVPTLDSAMTADEGPPRQTVATDADVSIEIPADVDQSVFDGLMQDAPGQAAELSELIGKIATGAATTADLVHAKRIAHTFKGSAHIVGIKGLAHIAHHTEDILEYFEREQTAVPPAIAEVLLNVAACLEQMTSSLLGEDDAPTDARDVLQSVLDWANRIDRGELDELESADGVNSNAHPAEPLHPEVRISSGASSEHADTTDAPEGNLAEAVAEFELTALLEEPHEAGTTQATQASDEAPFELSQLLDEPVSVPGSPSDDEAPQIGAEARQTSAEAPSDFDLDQLLSDVGTEKPQQAPATVRPVKTEAPAGATKPTRKVPATATEEAAPASTPQAEAGGAALVAQQALRVPVTTVDELFRLTSELAIKIGQLQALLKNATNHSRQLLTQNLAVQKRIFELENLVDVRGLAAMRTRGDKARIGGFDPLEMDQYNELHSVSRALSEETSDVRGMSALLEEDLAKLTAVYLQHDRIRKDLQYITTTTRMAPVKSMLPRLTRNVRQTCQATGKKAELEVEGGDTLLDGEVLSKLADPLLHILRNAVDHGVESAQERGLLGKPEIARIQLSFTRQGQSVVVRCSDDGRGLDFAAIRSKAIERGLLKADRVADERELARMILLPGFSTRDRVSEISGRGVGLDVVHNRILTLKGTIDIRSNGSGQGTTIEMRIPASLVAVHALLVRAGAQLFALPTHTIDQAFAPESGEFLDVAGESHFKHRDRLYPTKPLAGLCGVRQVKDQITAMEDHSVVLIRGDDRTYAVLVESIVDGRDLITKDMGRFVRRVRGVAGVAILGDGTIAPLLDVPEMLRSPADFERNAQSGELAAVAEQTRILVVDDSLGVRRSLMQLIGDSGLDCQSANDGVEAVQAIEKFRPHLVITDLEMPNMNGLELTAHLRKQAETRNLPIIMITSRSQAKHRELAEKSGVTVYLTKPYSDVELMAHIGKIVEGRADELKSAA